MMHILQVIAKRKTLGYWRNPTKAEIKFGYGAIHHREFEIKKCFDDDGFQKLKMKTSDDNLIYYYSGQEYFTTSKAKLKKTII